MNAIQKRIDEGIMAGRLTHVQGMEFQSRLDVVRRKILQQIKYRSFTSGDDSRDFQVI
jgi:hypothetical protein